MQYRKNTSSVREFLRHSYGVKYGRNGYLTPESKEKMSKAIPLSALIAVKRGAVYEVMDYKPQVRAKLAKIIGVPQVEGMTYHELRKAYSEAFKKYQATAKYDKARRKKASAQKRNWWKVKVAESLKKKGEPVPEGWDLYEPIGPATIKTASAPGGLFAKTASTKATNILNRLEGATSKAAVCKLVSEAKKANLVEADSLKALKADLSADQIKSKLTSALKGVSKKGGSVATKRKNRRNPAHYRKHAGKKLHRKKKMISRSKALKQNPLIGTGISAVQDVTKKLPVVGNAVTKAVPAAVYAVPAFFAHKMIASQVKDYMDGVEFLNTDYLGMGYLNPSHYAYTITGIAAASALRFIPANVLSTASKNGIGAALVIVGVVSDMVQDSGEGELNGLELTMNGLQLDMNGLQLDMNGIELDMNGMHEFGDGGQYYVSSLDGMHDMYGDADMMDAYYAGHDLDHEEGATALAGPRQWRRRFIMQQRKVSRGGRKQGSRHAGKKGHRWGWIIKLIGFKKFQQLAALPPQQRLQIINSLKQKAVAHVNQQLAEGGPVGPTLIEESGVTGVQDNLNLEGLGYGAVMLAGGSY